MLQEPQFNCFEMLLAEKLKAMNYEFKHFFWRAGLEYGKQCHSNLFTIATQDHYYDYYFLNYFGILLEEKINPAIEVEIEQSGSYIIKLDYFFLNYCNMYQKEHHIHAFIIDINEDLVSIQDNYFGCEKIIEKETLLSWWNYSQEFVKCKFVRIEVIDAATCKEISTLEALQHNIKLMTDQNIYQSYGDYQFSYGFDALEKIVTDILKAIVNKDFYRLDSFSEGIDTIRRSRKQAADFFELRGEVKIRSLYLKIYTKWSNVFMSILKIIVSTCIQEEIYDTMERLLKEITVMEHDAVDFLKERVKEIKNES
ncbi:hypothetical protein BCR24_14635 [Enterococcus ureilyticus]|uniref:Butirosin biosynthesis protein H N-terminal domain-containing protein n=1 Tax=Enterococcus ureilyticus TaxID=1131292 RepID=A0A1E5HDH2_9ENTE|nr:hypothetical protein [Enterococcus ureilyticus]MBM7689096.1 hypothetical protein [Enterococcus ureilyticus]MBO0445373.1 hypothetical protein [Enterococcus ureilyticus]OEG22855.1 hypothetical protein BCR24_14635 [Enterococcus ureilyticus]